MAVQEQTEPAQPVPAQLIPAQLRRGFDLGEWRVWPNAGQIEKDGVKIHIEPKLVEVLLLLAQNPGQVVTREELLDQAWQRQVVCDEALTRTISELRTLLGDSSRERRYIRTIPKRGYSLIADVEPLLHLQQQEVKNEKPQPTTEVRPEFQGLTNGAAWVPRESFTNRLIKYWLYGVGSLTTAFCAIFLLVFVLTDDTQVDLAAEDNWDTMLADASAMSALKNELLPQMFPDLKRYAVLPFTNLTPDQDLSFFTQGLEEDIRTVLSSLPGAQVAGRMVSNQIQMPDSEDAAAGIQSIASNLKVDAVLDGTVRLIDGQIRVTVQLLDGKTGFPLWFKRYDKTFDRVLKLQTQISEDVLCELESRLPKSQYLASVMTKRQRTKEEEMSLPADDYGHTRHIEWLAR